MILTAPHVLRVVRVLYLYGHSSVFALAAAGVELLDEETLAAASVPVAVNGDNLLRVARLGLLMLGGGAGGVGGGQRGGYP